jgi:hypothetical protein
MTRSEANVSICLDRALTAKTERERNWWVNEANKNMSEEKQPEQLPYPLDVSAPGPSQKLGEGGELGSSDDQPDYINGRCCQ